MTLRAGVRAALLVLGVMLASAVSAQESEGFSLATRLVGQARMHEAAALGMRLAARRAVVDGKAPHDFLACVSGQDPGIFSSRLASAYADGLSTAELKDALRFFESSSGRKYVANTLWQMEKSAGFIPVAPATSGTAEEQGAIAAFIASSLGKKISESQSSIAIAAGPGIAEVVESILRRCGTRSSPIEPPSATVHPGDVS